MAAIRWKWAVAAVCSLGVTAVSAVALAPATAQGVEMRADDGRVVVFDGGHAIVVEDAQGKVVRALELDEFLPAAYVRALPRNAEGLAWRRDAFFEDGQSRVEFSVAAPGSAAGASGPALAFSIDLADGRVRTSQIREYLAAADAARALDVGKAVAAR